MALAPIPKPPYPNVPAAPGVPPVLRQVGTIASSVTMLAADAVQIVRMFQGPQWGIFDAKGQPLIVGDSVLAVDYRQEFRVSDFPIEEGTFANYNKVREPYDIRITFTSDGHLDLLTSALSGSAIGSLISGKSPTSANRKKFLDNLDQAIGSLDLVRVVTPEATYNSVNIVHYDYRRDARAGGATLLRIDVWCQEVRIAAQAVVNASGQVTGTAPTSSSGPGGATSSSPAAAGSQVNGANTAAPGSATATEGGTVQPQQMGPTGSGTAAPSVPDQPALGGTAADTTVPIVNPDGSTVSAGGVAARTSAIPQVPGQSIGDHLAGQANVGLTPNYEAGKIVSFTQH